MPNPLAVVVVMVALLLRHQAVVLEWGVVLYPLVSVVREVEESQKLGCHGPNLTPISTKTHSGLLREKALRINPGSDMAKGFLGLALKLSGLTSESRNVLQDVADNGTDANAVNMAKSLLEEA